MTSGQKKAWKIPKNKPSGDARSREGSKVGERRIDELVRALGKAREEMEAHAEAHREVFDRHKQLTDACVGITEMIKIEARAYSKRGATVSVVNDGKVTVTVQGKEARVFNVTDAKNAWPSDVLSKVVMESINSAALDEAVRVGLLSEGDVTKAVKYEPMTPAVTIRFV